MKGSLKLALRMLARDWRAGELRILGAALVVAVASITSVGFFADRVGQALVRDAHQLLGADLVLASDRPWKADVSEEITGRGLLRAEGVSFISMALAGEGEAARSQLAGVKAVSDSYPLRGRLRVAAAQGQPDAPAQGAPRPGGVWLEERMVSALGTPVGSRLRLGEATLRVDAILTLEPERNASFFNVAPRLLMNISDLPATGLVQEGSRIRYYLYAAGEPPALKALEAWAKPRLERGQRIEDLETGRPEVRATLDRAQRFLSLTALLAAVLAGVAIALATRRFVERHLDGCAVLRCLGATQARLFAMHAGEFVTLGLGACLIGCAIGYGAQQVIALALEDLMRTALPAPGLLPALQGLLVGLVLLLGFALPPLIRLRNVPAVRVIRREAGDAEGAARAAYVFGMLLLAALLVWQAGDLRLGLYVVGGFGAAIACFALVSWLALRAVASAPAARLFGHLPGLRGSAFRYGLANLKRHARGNAVQVASLALGLTAVLLLGFTRNDLVEAWRRSAPPDAPNRFLIGVQPDQVASVNDFFRERGLGPPALDPMVRGRVVSVNGRPTGESDYQEERAKRLIEREFNLSYMDAMPAHNELSAGAWYAPGAREVSVEEGIARTLGWKLGDELGFTVGGERFSARISSLRRLRWDSMRVNFFVVAPAALLRNFPASFISAFRVEPGAEAALNALPQRFPNVTLVDIAAAVRQAQAVVDQLVAAVQFVFLFALGAGLLVLYSALIATEDERRREAAVMRVYGASRAQIQGAQRVEFLAMGAIAGTLAAFGAALIGQLVASRVFELDLPPNPWVLVAGPLAGLALLTLNAWLSARKVLRSAPLAALREA